MITKGIVSKLLLCRCNDSGGVFQGSVPCAALSGSGVETIAGRSGSNS